MQFVIDTRKKPEYVKGRKKLLKAENVLSLAVSIYLLKEQVKTHPKTSQENIATNGYPRKTDVKQASGIASKKA